MVGVFGLLSLLLIGFGLDAFSSEDSEPAEPESDDNTLTGTFGADDLAGGAGNDVLLGRFGTNAIFGGNGDDHIDGQAGDDQNYGNIGNDWLNGGFGFDTLIGGAGNDAIYVTADGVQDGMFGAVDLDVRDVPCGKEGDDTLFVGIDDIANGDEGADEFVGGTWIDPTAPAIIQDFDAAEDILVVLFDPALNPNPVVTTRAGADPNDVVVSLDGQDIMLVLNGAGAVTPDTIQLFTDTFAV